MSTDEVWVKGKYMLRRFLIYGFTAVIISLLSAGQSAAPPLIKISVVDWEKVTLNFEWLQQSYVKIRNRKKDMLAMIENENRDIKRMESDLENIIDAQRYRRQQQLIKRRKSELQNFYVEAMSFIEKQEEKLLRDARVKIIDVIERLAIREGISLVFSKNEILYAAEGYADLTTEVIKELNKEEKEGGN